jgi:hypothetical protein
VISRKILIKRNSAIFGEFCPSPKICFWVLHDGLDARLVVHVQDELFTARGSHHIRLGLVSSLTSEEILHTKTMYPYIISRMCNECDVLNNIVRGRLTHSFCFTHSCPPDLLHRGRRRSGRRNRLSRYSGVLNKSREVFPAQKAKDVIGVARVAP